MQIVPKLYLYCTILALPLSGIVTETPSTC
jgi:cytochrome b561